MEVSHASIAHKPHSTKLEQLPVELLCEILSVIDNLTSLSSATLASRTLYNAFINARCSILSKVLVNQVGVDMIPHALAAVESIPTTHEDWGAFLAEPARVPDLLTADQVYLIVRLSAVVNKLSTLFVQSAVGIQPQIQSWSPIPSKSELARIERTLYRFETLRNYFGALSGDLPAFGKNIDAFFATLAPWEVEQLGSIHDFLFHQIQPACDDIASHDVVWGSIEVEPALNYASPEVQAIMSSGLASVYRIATAKTYAERHKLLYQRNGPDRSDKFLYRALKRYSEVNMRRGSSRALFTAGQDRDGGPQDAWEWAHTNCAPRVQAYRLDRTGLRRWGYVFWDRARLEEISLFKEPFRPPRYVSEEHEVDDDFEASWRARKRVARAGGTGYWSATDQSQIVFAKRRQPVYHRRGQPRVGPPFANAKREFAAASARIDIAMKRRKGKTDQI
ncbi:hypothetical protein F5Y04DRAFT_263451 [Hypomontagnella monticulosa]|nr:hypothetical protein F5Y04DRAFT_263451 [Hypomontagnella monticulosa]